MITKNQYLSGECSKFDYYDQFVDDRVIEIVKRSTTYSKILAAKDKCDFNDIALSQWDYCTGAILCLLGKSPFREKGDIVTHNALISICKAAARQILARRAQTKA